MEFDLLIRNGTVVDGTGEPRFQGDVGICGETISVVGPLPGACAAQEIDARGCIVAPGFIDIHTHSDTSLLLYPDAESRIRQGITTEVVGNCSYSPFPLNPEVRSFMGVCLAQGMENRAWNWDDLEGYRRALLESGVAVNVAPQVGHGSVRIAAMGMENRPPRDDEIRAMQRLTAEAIDQGAFGFTTGLTLAPSSYSETAELIEISKTVARCGGYYATHSRLWAGFHFRAVEEALQIGRDADLPVQISHQTIIDPRYFGQSRHIVEMMEAGRRDGVDVRYDVYPYIAGGTSVDQLLPDAALAGGSEALLARLADSVEYARIRAETACGWFRGIPWQWDRVQLSHLGNHEWQHLLGKSLAEAGDIMHLAPLDAMLRLIVETENDVGVVVFNRDEADVQFFLAHPLSMVGSDGSAVAPRGSALETKPHPRFYGTYPRILGRYCRELQVLSLEAAIEKMTTAPAARLGLKQRGKLARGQAADIVIFDAEGVIDRATFDEPHAYPVGIEYVFVNGRQVLSPAGRTTELPGKVLARGSS